MARPNILFIMADQWHHLDFGYRNHPVVKIPHPLTEARNSV
jgi:arylsulfatase A-like enzyme